MKEINLIRNYEDARATKNYIMVYNFMKDLGELASEFYFTNEWLSESMRVVLKHMEINIDEAKVFDYSDEKAVEALMNDLEGVFMGLKKVRYDNVNSIIDKINADTTDYRC